MNKMEISFVQLGKSEAAHLNLNIRRLNTLFPTYRIHLVTDSEFIGNVDETLALEKHMYQTSREVEVLLSSRFTDDNFRGNFWRLTLERLIAFLQFHLDYQNIPILNLESDILLLPNAPLDLIAESQSPSWLRVDSHRDVAALLFSPSHESSQWLLTQLIEILESGVPVTDMTILRMMADKNPGRISLLPSLFEEENKSDNIFEPNLALQKKQISKRWPGTIPGIFDPAGIGMWLTGIDPRNQYGITSYFDKKSSLEIGTYFDPSAGDYRFERNCLFCKVGGIEYSIWNLHVHSKDLRLFSENWDKTLNDLVNRSAKKTIYRRFNIWLLITLLRQNHAKKTLFPYLMGIYPLNRIRYFLRSLR